MWNFIAMHSSQGKVQVRLTPTNCAIVALSISLLAHVIVAFALLRFSKADTCVVKSPQLDGLQARPVALSVVDTDHYGLYADEEWKSSIPVGGGFLRTSTSDSGEKNFAAVSLYHQLHCLNHLRQAITFGQNVSGPETHHAGHCLGYLRQMILCHSDITLEPVGWIEDFDGSIVKGATGIGVTHECRDWTQVRAFVEDHYEGWKWVA